MLTTKKRIIIGIPTIAIFSGIIIGAWHLLPEIYFVLFLICFAVLAMIFDHFVKKWEKK